MRHAFLKLLQALPFALALQFGSTTPHAIAQEKKVAQGAQRGYLRLSGRSDARG